MKKYILFLIFFTTMSSGFKMVPLHKLPIITAYKNIDKHIEVGLNNPITRSKLALITSHGFTDLISLNSAVVLPRYFNAACLCFYTSDDIRAILLFLANYRFLPLSKIQNLFRRLYTLHVFSNFYPLTSSLIDTERCTLRCLSS